jgi:hypothetical protein
VPRSRLGAVPFLVSASCTTSDNGHYGAHGLALLNEMRTWCVVRQGGRGTGKPDYRHLWRVGWIVHSDLFYRRGKKRKHQLQGGRVPLRECGFLGLD